MSDENKIRDAADAIKGIAEAVPIYQDVVQPAAQELGSALQTVAKTVHVALAPVSALVWGYEQIKDYLQKTLTEKLKDVPPENIITPNPSVAGPAVEALRFAAHEPSLRELYASLLATSMDATVAHKGHPAFVENIRQMTADEARIIQLLASGDSPSIYWIIAKISENTFVYSMRREDLAGRKAGCAFPDLMPSYMGNLQRLGLIKVGQWTSQRVTLGINGSLEYEGGRNLHYLQDEATEIIKSLLEGELKDWGEQVKIFEIRVEKMFLTDLGSQFCSACVVKE